MSNYPQNWKEIATKVKDSAEWRCVRCKHPHETPGNPVPCDQHCDPDYHVGGQLNDGKQRMLTVHHLVPQKDLCAWWNLAPLCQRCHLIIQGKVKMERTWMLPHSAWFRPYVAGYYAWVFGRSTDRDDVIAHADELIALGQGRA